MIATTPGRPVVSVPVLSNATTLTRAAASRCRPPLNSTPPRAALASAESSAAGIEITSAQGEATTISVIAR